MHILDAGSPISGHGLKPNPLAFAHFSDRHLSLLCILQDVGGEFGYGRSNGAAFHLVELEAAGEVFGGEYCLGHVYVRTDPPRLPR